MKIRYSLFIVIFAFFIGSLLSFNEYVSTANEIRQVREMHITWASQELLVIPDVRYANGLFQSAVNDFERALRLNDSAGQSASVLLIEDVRAKLFDALERAELRVQGRSAGAGDTTLFMLQLRQAVLEQLAYVDDLVSKKKMDSQEHAQFVALNSRISDGLTSRIHGLMEHMDEGREGIVALETKQLKQLYLLLSVNFFLLVSLTGFLTVRVIAPIEEVSEVLEDLSQGKQGVGLDESLKSAQDEVGRLDRAFERMRVSMKLFSVGKVAANGATDKKRGDSA